MSSNKPYLSVAIITFNEERIIEKTLSSLEGFADEIIIVDSHSTDKTEEIALRFPVQFIKEDWKGYAAQKNSAIDKCSGEWILSLDADEIITPELQEEIRYKIRPPSEFAGYKIPREFYIGDQLIKRGGYFPDRQLRLFKASSGARFLERQVHESISLRGESGLINSPLKHYAYKDLNGYKQALEKYAVLASEEISKTNSMPALRAAYAFIYRYVFRLGFLEGQMGYDLNLAYSKYVYKKYHLAELKSKKIKQ